MYTLATAQEAVFLLAQTAPHLAPDTSVTIAWGELFSTLLQYIAVALISLITWSCRFLPPQLYALMMTMRVDQLLQKAIIFGVNSVAGAGIDSDGNPKVMTVEISNRVLREALVFTMQHGGELVKQFAGKPVDLAEKLWARMPVGDNVVKPDFHAIAEMAILKLPTDRGPEEPAK